MLETLLPEFPKRDDGKGHPWRSNREVLNGILWIYALAQDGKTYLISFHHTRLTIAALGSEALYSLRRQRSYLYS